MTQTQMLTSIRALNAQLSVIVRDGEIRINYKGEGEGTAYYTQDRDDALATARLMARVLVSSHVPSGPPVGHL